MRKFLENRMLISVSLSVILTFVFVFAVAYGVTTITTNISTGNLTVTGTAGITGVTTVVNASSTNITNGGYLWNTGNATVGGTLGVAGAVNASSTLQATGNLWSYAKIGAGTSTPMAEISATSTATTTLYLSSDTAKTGGCIQMNGSDGTTVYRMYVNVRDNATTSPNGRTGFIALWEAGACK